MLVGEGLFQEILRRSADAEASDVHLKSGLPPIIRVKGDLQLISKDFPPIQAEKITEICEAIIPERLKQKWSQGSEIDIAYSYSGVGRYRLNIYRYRGHWGIVGRYIPFDVKNLEDLGLPQILKQISLSSRGLVLITGITGSGKSTTLASMINEWNMVRNGHIVTVEDPVEYLIRDRKSIVTQREVGLDTENFESGLRNALRQDPDVIMVGEMRDRETIRTAISAAETGHLVLSTLHTKDAAESLNRILGVFDSEEQKEIRFELASCLTAIVSQRLINTSESGPRSASHVVPAVEVLINTPRIKDCLIDPTKTGLIPSIIEEGDQYGMQSFDQHLFHLLKEKIITREVALQNASRPSDLDLKIRGIHAGDPKPYKKTKSSVSQIREITSQTSTTLELERPWQPKKLT